MPRRLAGHIPDPFGQLFVVQRRSVRIKLGELVKLDDGATHHKTAPRVMVAVLVLVRNNVAVFISKHGPVGEGERVAMEIKSRSVAGPSERSGKENRCKTTARSTVPKFHDAITNAQPHHLAMIYDVRNESNLDTSTLCHSGLFSGKCPSRLQAVSRRLPRRVAGSSGISETSPHEL